MMAVFTHYNFGDDGVQAEYIKTLLKMDYRQTDEYIEQLKLTDSKYAPSISQLYLGAKEVQKKSAVEVTNPERCPVCNDLGYCFYNKDIDGVNYQFLAHCICQKGQSLSYDGRVTRDREHASPYGVQSITAYFDDRAIKEMAKAQKISVEEKQKIKRQIEGLGLKMPAIKEVAPWEM
jgi:hypothetical protein